jgi:hypothetical protein
VSQKIGVNAVISEVFTLYRAHAGVLLPIAFWLFLAVAILEELAGEDIGPQIGSTVVSLLATAAYAGFAIGLVSELQEGRRDPSATELIRSLRPSLLPLFGAGILGLLGFMLGLVLFVVPGLVALIWWAVVAPVIVIERSQVTKAFGRSDELVKGNSWRVGVVLFIGFSIAGAASIAFVFGTEAIVAGVLTQVVAYALASAIIAPLYGLIAAVLYFQLRSFEAPAP